MRLWIVIVGALFAASAIVAGWSYWANSAPLIAKWWIGASSLEHAGQWGDSFGAFNALFGALGFAAVLTTLLVQSRALQLQQQDMHRQRFESSFFELLNLMRTVRAEIRFMHSAEYPEDRPKMRQGKDAVIGAVRELRFWIEMQGGTAAIEQDVLVQQYETYVHKPFESDFGPYFRLIYTMLDRLRSDDLLSESEKARYGNILRSQLPSHEIFLLGVNGLSPVSKDLRDLIEEFRMLKYLPPGLRRETLSRFYPASAFAPRSSSELPPSKAAIAAETAVQSGDSAAESDAPCEPNEGR
ncbi:MAG: putative phage abortive infection protein [Allosphingosinicella sp.]